MTLLVGAAVALAVVTAAGPRGRRVPVRRGQRWGATAWVRDGRRGRAARTRDADLAGLLLAVAARLRAGATPQAAWAAALGTAGDQRAGATVHAGAAGTLRDVVPPAAALRAVVAGRRRGAPDHGAAARVHAVVTGARTAAELGAPLADVLEDLAAATAADAEHAGEVTAALAGPRATARVLVLLPGLGLLVGAALGARPWEVLAGGGVGTAAGVLGGLLVLAGRAWVAALLRRARGAGGAA